MTHTFDAKARFVRNPQPAWQYNPAEAARAQQMAQRNRRRRFWWGLAVFAAWCLVAVGMLTFGVLLALVTV